jgi:hypothetical protein
MDHFCRFFVGLLAAGVASAACSASSGSGCTKDTDCAEGRICSSDGRCEDRSPSDPGSNASDSGGTAVEEGGSTGSDSGGASSEISGIWRLCGSAGYYVQPGGEVIVITAAQGQASAYELAADGSAVVQQTAGPDGGDTTTLLSGPYDTPSRVWTPQFYESGHNVYSARLTFSADGTRFTGTLSAYGPDPITWYGGREDGTFTCSK